MQRFFVMIPVLSALAACTGFSNDVCAYEADNASTSTLWAITDPAARVAADTARRGSYYGNRIQVFLNENKTAQQGGVVFLGDSLTERFPLSTAFTGQNVYNRGIGGDRIEGMLERLDCSVIALKPSVIYVLAGTNDILWPVDYKNGELTPGYERLLGSLRDVAPQATLICYTMPPLDASADRLGTCIRDGIKANILLQAACQKYGVELRDLHATLTDTNGNYRAGFSADGVHMTLDGYLNWLDLIAQTPEERYAIWKNMAASYAATASDTATITGINSYRANHTLILFHSGTGKTSTGTNQWGYEVKVVNGKVTEASSSGNMTLPSWPGGYVLSGIDETHTWLKTVATIGTNVSLSGDLKTVTVSKDDVPLTYETTRQALLLKMAKFTSPTDDAKWQSIAARLNSGLTTQQLTQILGEINGTLTRVDLRYTHDDAVIY